MGPTLGSENMLGSAALWVTPVPHRQWVLEAAPQPDRETSYPFCPEPVSKAHPGPRQSPRQSPGALLLELGALVPLGTRCRRPPCNLLAPVSLPSPSVARLPSEEPRGLCRPSWPRKWLWRGSSLLCHMGQQDRTSQAQNRREPRHLTWGPTGHPRP